MQIGRLGTINGINVIIEEDLVLVKRTWSERLRSWPWRPWVDKNGSKTRLFRLARRFERQAD